MNLPLCKSPQHPADARRDTMVLLEEAATHWVFACTLCRDQCKQLSVQVRTKLEFRQHISQQPGMQQQREQSAREINKFQRARVVRKELGKITYFH